MKNIQDVAIRILLGFAVVPALAVITAPAKMIAKVGRVDISQLGDHGDSNCGSCGSCLKGGE